MQNPISPSRKSRGKDSSSGIPLPLPVSPYLDTSGDLFFTQPSFSSSNVLDDLENILMKFISYYSICFCILIIFFPSIDKYSDIYQKEEFSAYPSSSVSFYAVFSVMSVMHLLC